MKTTVARILICCVVCLSVRARVGSEQEIRFIDVTTGAGLRGPLDGLIGHAAAWGDVDADGDLDLYVGGFADRPDDEYRPASGPVSNGLFRNLSNGRFEPTATVAALRGRTSGAVFADLDNDGAPDLYVANNTRASSRLPPGVQRDAQLRQPALFRNDRGTLVEITATGAHCLTAPGSARAIGIFDYDTDGALDVLVVEDRFAPNPRSRLCRNLGGFTFADVTSDAGLPDDLVGLGIAVADLNEDGRPDFLVTHSNRMFLSTAQGRYTEPTGLAAVFSWNPEDAEDWPAGAAFQDLNRDGRLDLVVGIHHDRARNRVYLNQGLERGIPQFRDVSAEVGLPAHLNAKSPHVEVQDFDNDGWPDVYFSSVWMDGSAVAPMVYRNLGVKGGLPQFELPRKPSEEARLAYFPAGPSGDFDGDGRVDLFLVNWFHGNFSRLLRNVSRQNRWLEVRVLGRRLNRMGIGAKVRVYTAGGLNRDAELLGFQEIGTGYGFGSGQAPVAHFGLGSVAIVDVAIALPDGSTRVLQNAPADQRLMITGS